MGIKAGCSRCDYVRSFALDLRGMFYRCPRCKEGVIAVGGAAAAGLDMPPGSSGSQSGTGPVLARDGSPIIPMDSGSGSGSQSGSGELRVIPPAPKPPLAATRSSDKLAEPPAPRPDQETDSARQKRIEAEIDRELGKPRTGTGKVKRILIECGLCGHHVAILPEFFGKTVRCPECRGASAFTESTLEPVKDEILGRIALDDHERRNLERPVPGPVPGPPPLRNTRRLVLGIVLAAVCLVVIFLVARAVL